jgi:hypothetical protein
MSDLQIKNRIMVHKEKKLHLANVLLISGEGRNVGKTTLGCRIISVLSGNIKVVAIKVSPHFHPLTGSLEVLWQSESIVIAREWDKYSGKDSSRYFRAGAAEVYYVQCDETALPFLASWIRDNIPHDMPVICESGGLGRTIQPGYAVYIRHGAGRNEQSTQPNAETIFNNSHPENVDMNIGWQNKTWQK